MTYKDFIGQEITEGCYVAYPGAGNAKAEYGLILYRVVGFDDAKKKIKAQRLDAVANYAQSNGTFTSHPSFLKRRHIIDKTPIRLTYTTASYQWMVTMIESTLENTNKLVVVNPPQIIKDLFDAVYNQDDTILGKITGEQVSRWILASLSGTNPFI
jgi:hypothetical protein